MTAAWFTQPQTAENMWSARAEVRSTLRFLSVLAIALLLSSACTTDHERPGSEPTQPTPLDLPDVTGSYSASRLIVEREGSFKNLIGEPDTRLDIHLNVDGSVQGQLKIGADPQLRTKATLAGQWRLRVPNSVKFDFDQPSFLEEVSFRILPTGLAGEWLGEDVRVIVELEKVG